MVDLKDYLKGKNVSGWCREHGITPEAVFNYLSGKRVYLGIEVAAQVVKATQGEVALESLVRPEVFRAVNSLCLKDNACL